MTRMGQTLKVTLIELRTVLRLGRSRLDLPESQPRQRQHPDQSMGARSLLAPRPTMSRGYACPRTVASLVVRVTSAPKLSRTIARCPAANVSS